MNREVLKKSSLHAAAKRAGIAITSVSTFTTQRSAAPFISGREHSRKKHRRKKSRADTAVRNPWGEKKAERSEQINFHQKERAGRRCLCVQTRACASGAGQVCALMSVCLSYQSTKVRRERKNNFKLKSPPDWLGSAASAANCDLWPLAWTELVVSVEGKDDMTDRRIKWRLFGRMNAKSKDPAAKLEATINPGRLKTSQAFGQTSWHPVTSVESLVSLQMYNLKIITPEYLQKKNGKKLISALTCIFFFFLETE